VATLLLLFASNIHMVSVDNHMYCLYLLLPGIFCLWSSCLHPHFKEAEDEELEAFIEENLQTPSAQIMWCLWCEPIKDCCCFLFRGCKRKTCLFCRTIFCCGESHPTKKSHDTAMDISMASELSVTEPNVRDDVERGNGTDDCTWGGGSAGSSDGHSKNGGRTSKARSSASSKAALYLQKKRSSSGGGVDTT
jgi:hypothetical protein